MAVGWGGGCGCKGGKGSGAGAGVAVGAGKVVWLHCMALHGTARGLGSEDVFGYCIIGHMCDVFIS